MRVNIIIVEQAHNKNIRKNNNKKIQNRTKESYEVGYIHRPCHKHCNVGEVVAVDGVDPEQIYQGKSRVDLHVWLSSQ